MAEWAVIADRITLFPHPNADSLLLGRVGHFQVVVAQSNGYSDGNVVVFAPERAVLPEDLRGHYVNSETGVSYLAGADHDRVKRVRLRGEYSEGVTIDLDWVTQKLGVPLAEVPLNTDLSEALGIVKYEAPIPAHMAGEVTPLTATHWHHHDVEALGIYAQEFTVGEPVNLTEKLHGSQIILYRGAAGESFVTSKGLAKKDLALKPSDANLYWQAPGTLDVLTHLHEFYPGQSVQAFGEVIPCQKGFSYGQTRPTIQFFRLVVEGQEVPVEAVPEWFQQHWVPILAQDIPFDPEVVRSYAKGREQVSGKELHIREGVVVSPRVPRRAAHGFPLYLKAINPKFKDSEEFIS